MVLYRCRVGNNPPTLTLELDTDEWLVSPSARFTTGSVSTEAMGVGEIRPEHVDEDKHTCR
jgi:hypothetical protein